MASGKKKVIKKDDLKRLVKSSNTKTTRVESKPKVNKTTKVETKPKVNKTTKVETKPKVNKATKVETKPKVNKTTKVEAKPKVNKPTKVEAKHKVNKTTKVETKSTVVTKEVISKSKIENIKDILISYLTKGKELTIKGFKFLWKNLLKLVILKTLAIKLFEKITVFSKVVISKIVSFSKIAGQKITSSSKKIFQKMIHIVKSVFNKIKSGFNKFLSFTKQKCSKIKNSEKLKNNLNKIKKTLTKTYTIKMKKKDKKIVKVKKNLKIKEEKKVKTVKTSKHFEKKSDVIKVVEKQVKENPAPKEDVIKLKREKGFFGTVKYIFTKISMFIKSLYVNKLTVVFTIIVITVSVLFIKTPDIEFSENENRYLSKLPEFSFEALFDGDYIPALEEYITDNFIFRDMFMKLKTDVKLLFNQTEINDVYVGDDYLFEKPNEFIEVDKFIETLNKFDAEHNKNIDFLLVPSSGMINTSRLPNNVSYENQELLYDYIYNNVTLNNIDVRDTLRYVNRSYQTYYRLDHHYTAYGAYFSYVEFCKENNITPIDLDITNVSRFFDGTLYSKAGIYDWESDILSAHITDTVKSVSYGDKTSNTIYDYEKLATKDKYAYFLGGNHPIVTIENNVSGDEILIIKDSFANSFIPYLTNHYSKIHVIDLRYYNLEVSDYIEEHDIHNILILYGLQGIESNTGIFKLR